ncbi:hypothetical protein [Stygiolobus caldivivus]|uniref:Uncharacterized protein n=1 Tax=Stygiolobus caldivivus TaxID=2824673 RepID=A0A8D5ZKG8_9CREN|nr:hypothetical protein [Stygiolobus caldivivus]BCU71370.1 hypothetical protein KN1_26670 [Stygiolobus caldivivus]
MKISNVESKYIVKIGREEILVQQARNERGEKIYIFQTLKNIKLEEGEEWNEDLSNVQTVDSRDKLPDDVKRVLRNVLK